MDTLSAFESRVVIELVILGCTTRVAKELSTVHRTILLNSWNRGTSVEDTAKAIIIKGLV